MVFPEGIAVDGGASSPSRGDVYVIDPRNNRIQKFTPSGEFLLMLGGEVDKTTHADICTAASGEECGAGLEGTGAGAFQRLGGRSVVVDSAGRLYVGDENRVQRFGPAGSLEAQIALPGSGAIEDLAVDSSGNLYVQSTELPGVRKYDPSGTELGKPRDFGGEPSAIAIGPADRLFVNDGNEAGAHHLLAYDPAGKQLASFDAGLEGGVRGIAYGETIDRVYVVNRAAVRLVAAPAPGPLVFGESATEVEPTTATLNATVNPEGGEETTSRFEYGTEAGVYSKSTPITPLAVNEIQTLTLTATEGTFTLSFEGEASAAVPFNAEASELRTALEAIPAIGAGDVTVTGPAGGPYAIEFVGALAEADAAELSPDPSGLGNSGEPGSASIATSRSGGRFLDRPVSAPISGLQPATTYHFRTVATNAAHETTTGPDQTFTTLPPVSIESTSVSQVTATSARLETGLDPHGLQTTYHFEYDLNPYLEGEGPHGISAPVPDASAGAGNGVVSLSLLLAGLRPATTYHFRVVAANSLGSVSGPDRAFTTQGAPPLTLPDGRGWELISPPNKNGVPLEAISGLGGVIQAAADGTGLTYFAKGAIDSQPAGNRSFANSQLLSRRGASGWSTADIATPHQAPVGLHAVSEYGLFSADLSRAAVEPDGATPLSAQASERTPYLRQADGSFLPLITAANVPPGTKFGGIEEPSETFGNTGVQFQTATPGLSHVLLSSPLVLTEPAFSTEPGQTNIYEWAAAGLGLVSQVPAAPETRCGATGPACVPASAAIGQGDQSMRQAISSDGSRVFFEATYEGVFHLFMRDMSRGETIELDAVQGGSATPAGGSHFQDASIDGSRVFFSDPNRLTADSTARPQGNEADLYMCEISESSGHLACQLRDLSVDPNPGQHADVRGYDLGSAADGGRVFFVANGQLAPGAIAGDCHEGVPDPTSSCNLYSVDTATATVRLIAVLSGLDTNDWINFSGAANLVQQTARVSPDGRYLAFMSARSLSGYDNRDARSGRPDQEVYLYDSQAGRLLCPSCNPSGARPRGVVDDESGRPPYLLVDRPPIWQGQTLAGSIPGWTARSENHALYQSRYLENSGRLYFNAADALVPQDSNGTEDVYQFEPSGVGSCTESSPTFGAAAGGCVDLISSGSSGEESAFLDASESGNDVFFLTASRLAPQDSDPALDVYGAHVCSSSLPCPPPLPPAVPECDGDACQQPAVPPAHPTPGTAQLNGPGNLHPKRHHRKHHRHHKHRRHHKRKAAGRSNRRGSALEAGVRK